MYILDVGIVYESLRTCHGVYKHTLTAYVAYIKKITDPAFDIHEPWSARIDKGQCVFDFKAPFLSIKTNFVVSESILKGRYISFFEMSAGESVASPGASTPDISRESTEIFSDPCPEA